MEAGSAIMPLAQAVGIEPRYWDIHGTLHETAPETMRVLLAAFGHPADSEADLAESLNRLAAGEGLLPPAICVRGGDITVPLGLDQAAGMLRWTARLEDGDVREGEAAAAELARNGAGKTKLPLPTLPFGYHDLIIEAGSLSGRCKLIHAPARCYLPAKLEQGRAFAVAAQLYALRKHGDMGIGDFSHLNALIDGVAKAGCDAIGLNPLHALFLDAPENSSPYSPASRLFRNPLYLDVTAIPEFAASTAAQDALAANARALDIVRGRDLIDYPEVARIKREILEHLFAAFCADEGVRQDAFRAFVGEGGIDLENFAAFQALSEHFATHDWRMWPQAYRDPACATQAETRKRYGGRIAFFQYLQWCCERQMADSAARARAAGMAVGLYNDLAISVNGASADHWAHQDIFAGNLRIGAPPDPFNDAGQEWGVVPMRPDAIRADGYRPFIALLRANMRHAGALRIDHVMGWRRLFLIPAGEKPAAGAYVRYPLEDFLCIAALESHRHRCLLIGEDLGTVPEGLRETLADANILSCRIFYFERDHDGFKHPDAYPALASSSIATHDLPTLRGFLDGADIIAKTKAGMLSEEADIDAAWHDRAEEKRGLFRALSAAGLLPEGYDPNDAGRGWDQALARAVQIYLARGPSKLFLVQTDDLFAMEGQANLPGTTTQHPNWRRRIARDIADALADPVVAETLKAINAARL